MEHGNWLSTSLVYLAAAVLAVPLARRLWAMRRPIFGGGSVQLLGSAALMAGIVVAAGAGWPNAT